MIFTPRASSTSAAPDLEDAARFPCFATGTPPAAMTREAVVEILKELLFWWMLLDNAAIILSKTWRKFVIESLLDLDKRR